MDLNILKKRVNYKPFEYPEVMTFIEAINKTYWVHSEVDFTADVQDFKSNLSEKEKEVIKRSLLSIAQVEVGVKTFWGDLYKHFPKPEFNGLGATFAECEFRHSEAYSRLLDVLGYRNEFEKLLDIPIFQNKLDVISDMLDSSSTTIIDRLIFFTIIIENASLFSQFANIVSFTRFKGYMKNVSNIISWTSLDEQIHANAGIYLINKIKEEGYDINPEWIQKSVDIYIDLESQLLDWIYENGELDFFSKEDMINFMKYRVDESLVNMGFEKMFNISPEQYKPLSWFEEEVFANSLDDFFAKRPVEYTKHDKSFTAKDLF